MARARLLKPGFFTNDDLARLKPLTRLLFAGLWCVADREGRLEDRPDRIKAEILPYDKCSVPRMLSELHDAGFIVQYTAHGKRFIQIGSFLKHQSPHMREPASVIPPAVQAPVEHSASTSLAPDEHQSSTASRVLCPIPDPFPLSGEGGSNPAADAPAALPCSEDEPTGFSERMGEMITALPKIARDETLYSEARQIALDYTQEQIRDAIRKTRNAKDEQGRPMGPYPSNWRRFLIPDAPKPEPMDGTPVRLFGAPR